MVLVYLEMIRTVEALEYAAKVWESRTTCELGGGYVAWAARQAHLWRSLQSHAAGLFDRARASHRPHCVSATISRSIPDD